ncbi:hypothetical protein K438DRAFT_1767513 [Mycena galopus ATCC 62051]|nr:hypothetical protein K438DRAFT_1767513 [Mycena galopus ATCC 62051]
MSQRWVKQVLPQTPQLTRFIGNLLLWAMSHARSILCFVVAVEDKGCPEVDRGRVKVVLDRSVREKEYKTQLNLDVMNVDFCANTQKWRIRGGGERQRDKVP